MPALAASDADAALQQAFLDLRRSLLAQLTRWLGGRQEAEDLLQDVLLKTLAARRRGAPAPDNLAAWLHTVARHAAMDHHRRRRGAEPAELDEALAEQLAAETPDERAHERELLSYCLRPMAELLPPIYREALLGAEFDGLPLAQIAAAQGVSLGTIKSRTSRARRLLLERMVGCCKLARGETGELLAFDAPALQACAATELAAPRPGAGCGGRTRGGC